MTQHKQLRYRKRSLQVKKPMASYTTDVKQIRNPVQHHAAQEVKKRKEHEVIQKSFDSVMLKIDMAMSIGEFPCGDDNDYIYQKTMESRKDVEDYLNDIRNY